MTRKSLGTCVLLLGLLLGTSSAAYADAFVITSVTLTNFQLVPASGTVVFSGPQAIAHTVVVNGVRRRVCKHITNSAPCPSKQRCEWGKCECVVEFHQLVNHYE